MNAHDPAKAVTILDATAPYELGSPRSSLLVPFGSLYSVYVRGLAYLALRQGDKAVAEFEKIVLHRGIVAGDVMMVAARLKLARFYATQGQLAKAKSAYQSFLADWHAADPLTPILDQARSGLNELSDPVSLPLNSFSGLC
ncbi:MAG: hypothetical protein ABSH39_21890 [Candidatus Acidiferrum sp.]